MKTTLIILAALLSACGGPVECRTRAGIVFEELQGWTCEEVQALETQTLEEFKTVTDWRFRFSREAVYGYRVSIQPTPNFRYMWRNQVQGPVSGVTDCETAYIMIGDSTKLGKRAAASSFAHEIAHAIQRCYAGPNVDTEGTWAGDSMHGNWTSTGIDAAVIRIWENTP
jgi:hypothetical protein